MPKNKCKLTWLSAFSLLSVCLLLAGCGTRTQAQQPKLYEAATTVYEHPHIGVVVTVPASWLILSEAEDSVVFMEPEGKMTLTMAWELGGYTYYSDQDLLDIGEAVAGQILQEPEILQRVSRSLPGNNQLITALGFLQSASSADDVYDKAETDEETSKAVCEVMIFSPLPALRYYLITVAEPAAYEQSTALLSDISASFYLNETEDTLYEGLHPTAADIADTSDTDTNTDTDADAEQ